MVKRYKLECLGEDVVMVVDGQRVMFEGWDEEAEEAYLALGGEKSSCWIVAQAIKSWSLDRTLMNRIADPADSQTIEALIVAGADIHTKDQFGDTPLHIAAQHNDRAHLTRLLLDLGASVHETQQDGWTPLHDAAHAGVLESVIMLLEAGADIDAETSMGSTAYDLASQSRYTDPQAYDLVLEYLDKWYEEH